MKVPEFNKQKRLNTAGLKKQFIRDETQVIPV
jgi:hypothetical protein